MDPEQQKLLQKILKTTQDNQEILKKLHRSAIWGRVFRVIYWFIIIGIAVGVFYFLQPFIQPVMDLFSNILGSTGAPGIEGLLTR